MSSFEGQTVRYQLDGIYEQFAKPDNDYSVYSNKRYPGEILLGKYQVERVFQDKSSGFYALGLVSVSGENPPVLVIRGFGNWGKLEDFPREFLPYEDIPDVVITDSDGQFQAAKNVGALAWLQDKAASGMKADVVGQSLGGKVGQQLAIEVPDCIHSLITFNSIGISSKEFEKYKGNVEIFHYINPVDLVPYLLGEKFLPGTILQVGNSSIKNWDLLGQHNKLVLDNPVTVIQKVEIDTFSYVRELYRSIKDYAKIVKQEVDGLNQIAKQELSEYQTILNTSGQTLKQQFEGSCQALQQEFSQIVLAIRQELLDNPRWEPSAQHLQKQVNESVEVIQNEVESLNQSVELEINNSSNTSKSLSQALKQELKDAIGTVKQKLAQFLQVETSLKGEEKPTK